MVIIDPLVQVCSMSNDPKTGNRTKVLYLLCEFCTPSMPSQSPLHFHFSYPQNLENKVWEGRGCVFCPPWENVFHLDYLHIIIIFVILVFRILRNVFESVVAACFAVLQIIFVIIIILLLLLFSSSSESWEEDLKEFWMRVSLSLG